MKIDELDAETAKLLVRLGIGFVLVLTAIVCVLK